VIQLLQPFPARDCKISSLKKRIDNIRKIW
jgi:hypothetical protein